MFESGVTRRTAEDGPAADELTEGLRYDESDSRAECVDASVVAGMKAQGQVSRHAFLCEKGLPQTRRDVETMRESHFPLDPGNRVACQGTPSLRIIAPPARIAAAVIDTPRRAREAAAVF